MAPRPHPSRHGSKSTSSLPVTCSKFVRRDVRRRDRGQRPTATVDPPRRRPSRRCSRVRWPRFPHLAPGHILQNTDPNPLLRCRSPPQNSFGETFGAATGVSDPRLQKIRIQNNHAGGQAAAVAGYAGPGFLTWPPGHILQNTHPNPLPRCRSPPQNSFGQTFGAATGVSDPRLQKTHHAGGQAAAVAGYDGPGFHTWPRPHPSKHGSASAFTLPVTCSKFVRRDVRRRDRGQRPTATVDPHTKQPRRRPSRRCSRVRWPRFPHLAPRPHPSRHGSESASPHPASCQKNVRRDHTTNHAFSAPRWG